MSEETKPSVPNLPEPPPDEFPRPFGNYLLLAPLARGGMGEVFLAKHGSVAGLEKHCVVKTLRPHLTDDREYTSRFIDEARIVVQLGHRNICHVFDVGTVGERYYLAMEYIAGKDLRALAGDVADGAEGRPGGVIHPGLALHIVSETLEALDYAHRQVDAASGQPLLLVHRDVSPQNVMLSWEGEVKLIDFGLAASTLKVEQTSPNVVMGKLAYMAPEQVRGERVDGRADLFAATVMLYELLVGERFYEGRSPYEIWGIAAQGGYRPRGWPVLDDEMRVILDKGLAAKPADRFATGIELREALQKYLQARGLRGDAPMLRALMHQVYAAQIEDSRKSLAALSKAKVPARFGNPDSTSGPSTLARLTTEPTQSIARSPSTSFENRRRATDAEGTEPTSHMQRPGAALAGARLPLAGLALFAVAAAVAFVTLRARDVPAEVPAEVPPLAAVVDAGAAVAAADAGAASVAVAAAVDAGAAPDAGAAEDADGPALVAAEDDGPKRPRDRRKRAKDARAVREAREDAKAPPADAGVASEVREAKPTYKHTSGWEAKLDVLRARCASLPCMAAVEAHSADFGSLQPSEFKPWRTALQKCWAACGLPMK